MTIKTVRICKSMGLIELIKHGSFFIVCNYDTDKRLMHIKWLPSTEEDRMRKEI